MANSKKHFKQKETVSRGVRIPKPLDDWLVQKLKAGFRSVPEVIIDLVRKARDAEEAEKAA
jgi:Arc/MetJ-type ribon-helix-helix transcriptional regulator